MRVRNHISPSRIGIPLSKVNGGYRGNRAIRANGPVGKGFAHPNSHNERRSWIPICPKCHFQREQ